MTPDTFIAQIGPEAKTCCIQTGVPASITLAQGALESGWGQAARGNNLFGIKADASWTGPVVEFPTHEFVKGRRIEITAKFRAYSTWLGSLLDHTRFFFENPRYAPALAVRQDPTQWAVAIQQCGYATDPDYASKLLAIVHEHSLTLWDVPQSGWNLLEWAK